MRPSNRLLSSLKAGRLLEPYAPTGLTGLFTHPAPRSTLIYLYNATLDKLKHLPESSVYRQSTEALTKHRLSIVESKKPASYDEWAEKVRVQVAQNPDAFNSAEGGAGRYSKHDVQGKSFIRMREIEESDERTEEWDGEQEASEIEGSQTSADRAHQKALGNDSTGRSIELESLQNEPQLDADQ
jgi:NADH dehydrogenase (ubiquinone) 1 alpha subcomplex subunit 5